jgi:hypothetical protein
MEELNEFIDKIKNELNEKLNNATEQLIIQDIIMIYNRTYESYEVYRKTMMEANMQLTCYMNTNKFYIHPKHIILKKELYAFILSLKAIYK